MAGPSSKNAKESKMEKVERTWTAKPILTKEVVEDPPLQDVFVGILKEKKNISIAIKIISSVLPGLTHLKRCSACRMLLAPLKSKELIEEARGSWKEDDALTQDELKEILRKKKVDVSLFEDEFLIVKVPSRPVKTKSQASRASKIWPVNFHPDMFIESLIDGSIFDEDQLGSIEEYMSLTVDATKSEAVGNSECNGSAVIVDPEDGRILAIAASRINEHPLWHASMLAVDLVARLQGGGAWNLREDKQKDSSKSEDSSGVIPENNSEQQEKRIKRKYEEEAPLCYPTSLSNINLPLQRSLLSKTKRKGQRKNQASFSDQEESVEDKCGPYLCTGYWVFLLREPCPMCAMSLLHSRVSRIFYGVPNESTGILGSNGILHAVPGLNHRYLVWSGILEQECQRTLQEIENKHVS